MRILQFLTLVVFGLLGLASARFTEDSLISSSDAGMGSSGRVRGGPDGGGDADGGARAERKDGGSESARPAPAPGGIAAAPGGIAAMTAALGVDFCQLADWSALLSPESRDWVNRKLAASAALLASTPGGGPPLAQRSGKLFMSVASATPSRGGGKRKPSPHASLYMVVSPPADAASASSSSSASAADSRLPLFSASTSGTRLSTS